MLGNDVIFSEVLPSEIKIDMRELSARLGGYCTACSDIADRYAAEIFAVATMKYAAVLCDVEYCDDGAIKIAGKKIYSEALAKNLAGAKRAFLLAVTLGVGVDTYLKRAALRSESERYFADGVASAVCEALCELASARICEGYESRPRFSPGYSDLPLSFQTAHLKRLRADSLLGITLTSSMLMIPTKSITAIIGIK